MDPGVPSGGQGGAPSPMELVLIAYGGCIAMTATALLRKKAPGLEDLRVELEADLSESRPHVFTHITAKFIVHGKDLKEEDVEWAISRAHEKYCPCLLYTSISFQQHDIVKPGKDLVSFANPGNNGSGN